MIQVTVVIVRSLNVTVSVSGVIGVTWAGLDEGNSTTVYTDGITDQ